MRLGGLISGVDTETLVSALMELERTRLYRQENKQAELEQKRKAWQQVRSALNNLQSKADQLRFSTLFRSRKVELSDASVATVTADAGAAQTSYTLQVIQLAQSHMITQAEGHYKAADETLEWAGTFKIGTESGELKEIQVEATDTLSTLAAKINAANSGVYAHVVTVGEGQFRLVLTSAKSGTAHKIVLGDEVADVGYSQSFLHGVLGLLGEEGYLVELSKAQDAHIKLNGTSYFSSDNTFDNILPGVKITAKKPSGDSIVSMTVSADTDKVVQAVKEWVSAVNSLQDLLQSLSAYDMDKQTGAALFGESLVRSIQYNIRKVFSDKINSTDLPPTMNMLAHVGISTGAYGSSDFGRIVLDEHKLREALQRDPEGVARVFGFYKEEQTSTGEVVEHKGFALQMYDYIKSLFDLQSGPIELREKTLTKQISSIKETIARLEYQLELREQSLRRQFEQMERAMATLQSQGNYFLMQMFGGMMQSS